MHGIVPEGVFTESGHFVHIPDVFKNRAVEFWQERVFALLLDEHKISEEVAGSTRSASLPPPKPATATAGACAACAGVETLRVQCRYVGAH